MKAFATDEFCFTAYSDTAIPFGVGVVYGGAVGNENRPKIALPSATGFLFMGVSCFTHKQTGDSNDGFGVLNTTASAQYEIGDDITVKKRGYVWVYSEIAVDMDDPVFLRHTVNSALVPGNFRIDADTAKADQLTNVRWACKTTAAGLAILELNIP
ncbi:hypothetical protein GM3709_2294 [Geminocystis sp. NIES-3709]|nr:hypothetical protein GM3709_2294 [Geminocystis sp. NIES-3709]